MGTGIVNMLECYI